MRPARGRPSAAPPLPATAAVLVCLLIYPPAPVADRLWGLLAGRGLPLPAGAAPVVELLWSAVPLALVLLWMQVRGGAVPARLRVRPAAWRGDLVWSAAVYAVLRLVPFGLMYVVLYRTAREGGAAPAFGAAIRSMTPLGPLPAALPAHTGILEALLAAACIPVFAVAEEILFRAIVYGSLRATAGLWWAGAISMALFVAAHPPAAWIGAFVWGLAYTALFEARKSLAAPCLLHLANNATVLLLAAWPAHAP